MEKKTSKRDFICDQGKVIKILGNSTFLVQCSSNGVVIPASLTSEFRSQRKRGFSAKIVEGSFVKIQFSQDCLKQARIVAFAKSIDNLK